MPRFQYSDKNRLRIVLFWYRFLDKLSKQIAEFGLQRMQTELDAYNCLNKAVWRNCGIQKISGNQTSDAPREYANGGRDEGTADVYYYVPHPAPGSDAELTTFCNRLARPWRTMHENARARQQARVEAECFQDHGGT